MPIKKSKYITKTCKKHGKTKFVYENSNDRYRCVSCRTENVRDSRKRLKEKLLDYFGGKCSICGYKKCRAALQFHHIKGKKEFEFNVRGLSKSFARCLKEAKKCILVCANCHADLHYCQDKENE